MGCTVREKHLRINRKTRSIRLDIDTHHPDRTGLAATLHEFGLKLPDHRLVDDVGNHRNPNLNPSSNYDECGWGYCTEDQLEELLLKNLEFLYNEAIAKLVALGYDEDVALKAILRNGHCYGSMDVLTNILHNSLAYLNSTCSSNNGNSEDSESVFIDLRQIEEYSLAGMVCLLQQVRPQLSKGDAMWCLLMSDLHVGRASTMEIPALPPSNVANSPTIDNDETTNSHSIGIAPGLCKFHGGWGFGDRGPCDIPVYGGFTSCFGTTLTKDIECPKRFNLSPSMKSLLKRNVAAFAAGFRANTKATVVQTQVESQSCPSSLSNGEQPTEIVSGSEVQSEHLEEPRDSQISDVVHSVLSSLGNLSLDEKPDGGAADPKNEVIMNLIHQIRELEGQVKERKEWAHQKAMQAARKLSNDLTELKMLRMEREETQRLKKGKQALEDTTMKRLSEMENALRKASGQVDRANAAVRRLETENAEIRAEMVASKLSASESVTTCLEVARREKKCLKRLLAWEKQKAKLQEDVAEEKKKISELQQLLHQIHGTHKETEGKWRQELKAKELAMAQAEEERRSKNATEVSVKRMRETLRGKIEIDFQRHKDDIQRLEQELSLLKVSVESTLLNCPSNTLCTGVSETVKSQKELNVRLFHELNKLQDSSENEHDFDRKCSICMKDEVSVVFLPCAHQVLCANCNEEDHKKTKATCPCCRVQIEQRIYVYGASS
ncbi:MND1-interacting protein 1-like [Telopea speciosissima]|uniref:MND1-interacting protein 1-like n=1 Tax=Telopea speciosissima TaxID=54955 RepID=UPI001CC788EF|nr:MND1-interacting protein 1-like [Telopea speciosissima]XP_043716971.1 MND1-interacting protein 1-like [Telopea speciosissima]